MSHPVCYTLPKGEQIMEKLLEFIQSILVLILLLFGGGDSTDAPQATALPVTDGSAIQVHYIDVGQADAALVLCDGAAMLIDGGNADDSSLIYTYLKDRNITYLDYVVCTHAHEDHVGGLSGALHYATTGIAYCPVTDYDSKAFCNFKNALTEQDVDITVPAAGDQFPLGSALVTILSCDSGNADPNATSIVLRIDHGETSFLFTGDAEDATEQAILDAGWDVRATVLKVGHHGSSTGTGYRWLYEVQPEYAVISVGEGNSYGHPHVAVLSRLQDADVTVYRTDRQGDIVCTGDGKTVTFDAEK